MDKPYITDPTHGGKVTCHKCNGFIEEGSGKKYDDLVHKNDKPQPSKPGIYFHSKCFNRYEHYYGLDEPVD